MRIVYEYISDDPKNISKYAEALLENKNEEKIRIKISSINKNGETLFGVDSNYKEDMDSSLEFRSIDYEDIGNYLETRITEGMKSLEVAALDGVYDVYTINNL